MPGYCHDLTNDVTSLLRALYVLGTSAVLERVVVFLLFLAFGGLVIGLGSAGGNTENEDEKQYQIMPHEN